MHKLIAILAVAGGAALIAQPEPAKAETIYPWCAIYSGGLEGNGGTNCGFETHKQCWDTVAQGRIGDCFPNGAYQGAAAAPQRPHKRHHVRAYPG
jgi:hypothetical protein